MRMLDGIFRVCIPPAYLVLVAPDLDATANVDLFGTACITAVARAKERDVSESDLLDGASSVSLPVSPPV